MFFNFRNSLIAALFLFTGLLHGQQSAARIWNEQLLDAIRRNVPHPPAHARNLFHTAAAMYNAWAAYDSVAIGYVHNEKVSPLPPTPAEIETARHEAISYAAYRVLRSRFSTGSGAATSLASFDAELTGLGYSTAVGQGAVSSGSAPSEVGVRIGQAILDWGAIDQFNNLNYPQPYNSSVNPNLVSSNWLSVLGTNLTMTPNMPLGYGIPATTNPNYWQPLDLSASVSQNGIPIPGGSQTFVGVQALAAWPFSLDRSDPTRPWVDLGRGPSRVSTPGNPSPTDAAYKAQALDVLISSSQLNATDMVNISPGGIGDNPLGADTGTGYLTNPITGLPYAPKMVKRGDYTRVLAEFWADGPHSETPPGHWHVLANEVADDPDTVKRIRGVGPIVNDLEWDVKTYFALAGAVHDAACAAWSVKRFYSGARPITMIRYLGSKGQSSDPDGPSYSGEGLPLLPNVVEVITDDSTLAGEKHEFVWDVAYGVAVPGIYHIGEVAVYSWPGEHANNLPAPSIATHQSEVQWMLAKDWLPFQRKTFNTPAFPGYVSGHSTFSRAAATTLHRITGSPYFPGGFHHHTYTANSMQIDLGPSEDVDLQWCSYYDAADQAGQSRRFGGIHPAEDDFDGRIIGARAGEQAFALAEKYWTGQIVTEKIMPSLTFGGSSVTVAAPSRRGLFYRLERCPDLSNWQSVAGPTRATGTTISFEDPTASSGPRFYRVVSTAGTMP